jgi:hypothetical protein
MTPNRLDNLSHAIRGQLQHKTMVSLTILHKVSGSSLFPDQEQIFALQGKLKIWLLVADWLPFLASQPAESLTREAKVSLTYSTISTIAQPWA